MDTRLVSGDDQSLPADAPVTGARPAAPAFGWLAGAFAATILVSAFLLFQVQPLISKVILSWFGGTPAVWTTCMLFFQIHLFCGYGYAHLIQRLLPMAAQAILHSALLAAALITLPVIS